jgi:hypothetical protein
MATTENAQTVSMREERLLLSRLLSILLLVPRSKCHSPKVVQHLLDSVWQVKEAHRVYNRQLQSPHAGTASATAAPEDSNKAMTSVAFSTAA